jgi:hypothetical protein
MFTNGDEPVTKRFITGLILTGACLPEINLTGE